MKTVRCAILAGTSAQALEFTQARGIPMGEWFWPRNVEHAESINSLEVYVLPSFDTHPFRPGLVTWFSMKADPPPSRWTPPHLR